MSSTRYRIDALIASFVQRPAPSRSQTVLSAMRLFVVPFAAASMMFATSLYAQKVSVQGSVFVDANGNGRRDAGERGISGVSISNQDAVVATDAAGEFKIDPGPNDIVFISVPDNYRVTGQFWRSVAGSPARVGFCAD